MRCLRAIFKCVKLQTGQRIKWTLGQSEIGNNRADHDARRRCIGTEYERKNDVESWQAILRHEPQQQSTCISVYSVVALLPPTLSRRINNRSVVSQ